MKRIQKTLAEILDIAYSLGTNVVLMGEISLYFHGLDIKPNIIEILIDEGAIYLFEEKIKKLRFKILENMDFRSEGKCYNLSASYMIYGIKVRVFANLTFKQNDFIEKFVAKKVLPFCEYKYFNKTEIPITSLELELVLSFLRDKKDYVDMIIQALKERGANMNHLKTILSELPLEKKNEIKEYLKNNGLIMNDD